MSNEPHVIRTILVVDDEIALRRLLVRSGVLVPVLQKPFNLDDVLDVLERVLAGASGERVAGTRLA